jgi:transposase
LKQYSLTMKDIERYKIIKEWIGGNLDGVQASTLLGVSYRHALRLKKAFKERGIEGIIPKKRGGRNSTPESLKERIAELYNGRYGKRFNILHFNEKLNENEGIHLSYGTVRKILMEKKVHKPKKRRKRAYFKRRKRMPKEGMLLQMDSSFHHWLENIPERWYLITIVDDATNRLLYARFFPKDTVFNNMEGIRKVIEKEGLFMALYVDKASHFNTTRYAGVHYDVSVEQEETNIERALEELGITLIPANTPQAKGRIERDFGTLQDRLINELWLAGIKDYKEANRFLRRVFISYFNKRFSKEADGSVYKPPMGIDLHLIFTKRYTRSVSNDNTISFFNQEILIPPSRKKLNFSKKRVEVRLSSEGIIWILYKGEVIYQTQISEENSLLKKEKRIESILRHRSYD